MKIYYVDSYHINVGAGDAALHVLVELDFLDTNALKVVWIDGGKPGSVQVIKDTIETLIGRYNNYKSKKEKFKFDAVVITHWDHDHCGGFFKFLKEQDAASYFRGDDTKIYFPQEFSNAEYSAHFGTLDNVFCLKKGTTKLAIPVYGYKVIGTNLFTGTGIGTRNPRDVVNLHKLIEFNPMPKDQPAMYCVANNGVVIGSNRLDGKLPRTTKKTFVLRASCFAEMPTAVNQASLAAIIAWEPVTPGVGRVSHYFAGDLDYRREYMIYEWLRDSKTSQVPSMKTSHHGDRKSTPPAMIDGFQPNNILFSSSGAYGHPAWELILFLYSYCKSRQLAEPKIRAPLNFTCYPKWLSNVFGDNTEEPPDDILLFEVLGLSGHARPAVQKVIDQYRQILASQPNELYDVLVNYAKRNKKDDEGAIYQKLREELFFRSEGFLMDRVTMAEGNLYEAGTMHYLMIRSYRDMLDNWKGELDGQLYIKERQEKSDERVYKDGKKTAYNKLDKAMKLLNPTTNTSVQVKRTSSMIDTVDAAIKEDKKVQKKHFTDTASKPVDATDDMVRGKTRSQTNRSKDNKNGKKDGNRIKPQAMFSMAMSSKAASPSRSFMALEIQPTSDAPSTFSVWGSVHAGTKDAGKSGRILGPEDLMDTFICSLVSSTLLLIAEPATEAVAVSEDDGFFQWMKCCFGASSLRAKKTPVETLGFSFKIAKGLEFESALADSTLNPEPIGQIGPDGLLGQPGKVKGIMAFGLSPQSQAVEWNMGEIYTFFQDFSKDYGGVQFAQSKLSYPLNLVKWRIDLQTLKGARNAIWFNPCAKYETTLRLAFQPAAGQFGEVKNLIQKFWPSDVAITVKTPTLICNYKADGASSTNDQPILRATLDITLATSIQVTIEDKSVTLDTFISLSSDNSASLTVQAIEGDFLEVVQKVIGKAFDADANLDSPILNKFKESFSFRRLCLRLKDDKLSGAQLGMEIKTTCGASAGQSVSIYLEAGYLAGGSGKGLSLSGGLWFPSQESKEYPYRYYRDWEPFRILQPIPKPGYTTAVVLSLLNLLPDSLPVEGFPKNIPQLVTDAQFFINKDRICVSGAISSCTAYYHEENKDIPTLDFSELTVQGQYDWGGQKSSVSMSLEFRIKLKPPKDRDEPEEPPSTLIGQFTYSSASAKPAWSVGASIDSLSLGMLYQYFEPSTRDALYDVLKDIQIRNMEVGYISEDGGTFHASGQFLIGNTSIELIYQRSKSNWFFKAALTQNVDHVITLRDIATSIFGEDSSLVTGMPDFLATVEVFAPNSPDNPQLALTVNKLGDDGVQLKLTAKVKKLTATFIQCHNAASAKPQEDKGNPTTANGDKPKGPVRYLKISFQELEVPSGVPLFDNLELPFDELGFLWVNSALLPADVDKIASIQSESPVRAEAKDGMLQGFHLTVLNKGSLILDYPIGKARAKSRDEGDEDDEPAEGTGKEVEKTKAPPAPIDGQSAKQPFKKSQGPLTFSDIRFHYKENTVSIQLDAVFAIGPLTFALIGFEFGLHFKDGINLKSITTDNMRVSIDGLSASFNKPPLTLEGGLMRIKDEGGNMYAGGITIGFVPWLFQAAGFYGQRTDPKSNAQFTSAFVFATLRGPLITLEFATISGITGAFGYNVDVRIPTVDEIYKFPLVAPPAAQPIHKLLKSLMTPEDGSLPWFTPKKDSMWLAAGLTVTAFEMLNITAVLVAQWSPQLQFHVLGLAVADIPNAHSPIKFAHVELGFLAKIDVPIGLFRLEAQLSPNSYILHESCHLSGGFALFYWFKTTDAGTAGDFVFTIGGYHSAYQVPANYPKPPRLAISWSFSDAIAIRGEAYFAITPKACMAGMHISAVFTAGPIRAWFDAYADFLINYAPFNFQAVGHVSVGVSFNLDKWFIHIHIGVEIGATLYLYGPPVHGSVNVDFWIMNFEIKFGKQGQSDNHDLKIKEFYDLVLAAGSKAEKVDHVYACLGGLIAGNSTEQGQKDKWNVRGGPFSFSVSSYMAIGSATVNDDPVPKPDNVELIYAKPMRQPKPLTSTFTVTITHKVDGKEKTVSGWRPRALTKSVPSALWGQYDESTDPTAGSGGKNSIDSLLVADNGTSTQMMSIEVNAPIPDYAKEEKMAAFDIEKAFIEDVVGTNEDLLTFPKASPQSKSWLPADPLPAPDIPLPIKHKKHQWELVEETWRDSSQISTVSQWSDFMGWKGKVKDKKPDYLIDHFQDLYLEAPCICVSA